MKKKIWLIFIIVFVIMQLLSFKIPVIPQIMPSITIKVIDSDTNKPVENIVCYQSVESIWNFAFFIALTVDFGKESYKGFRQFSSDKNGIICIDTKTYWNAFNEHIAIEIITLNLLCNLVKDKFNNRLEIKEEKNEYESVNPVYKGFIIESSKFGKEFGESHNYWSKIRNYNFIYFENLRKKSFELIVKLEKRK